MADQHYLRTKYIPFRPDAIVQTNASINQPNQVFQPILTGQVIGHVYQNVWIGGGLITQKVPIQYTQANHVFVSPVNLIGSPMAPTKIVQTQWPY